MKYTSTVYNFSFIFLPFKHNFVSFTLRQYLLKYNYHSLKRPDKVFINYIIIEKKMVYSRQNFCIR